MVAADSACVLAWLRRSAQRLHEQREYLTGLDAAIGDGDHGINMDRGFKAVLDKLPGVAEADIGTILKTVGSTLVSTVGGASGPLYGTAFLRAGIALAGKQELQPMDVAAGLDAALEGIIARGRAQAGEKTMVDALAPAIKAFKVTLAVDRPLQDALLAGADAAQQGAEATIPLVATKGRASYLGERSAGHQDPGATSVAVLLRAALTGR
ncbi:MAG TPA: dihydroxyacetone kinase subunit DhaL [Ktedonobacterales bacterium]|nr:dihydroxyacetone kinase subunit DhaL [Ktedonobacterales bacterium]